jgi:hypothetical protein
LVYAVLSQRALEFSIASRRTQTLKRILPSRQRGGHKLDVVLAPAAPLSQPVFEMSREQHPALEAGIATAYRLIPARFFNSALTRSISAEIRCCSCLF